MYSMSCLFLITNIFHSNIKHGERHFDSSLKIGKYDNITTNRFNKRIFIINTWYRNNSNNMTGDSINVTTL